MRYIKHLRQETVVANDAVEFDSKMNDILDKATKGGFDPMIHYFDNMGLCATVQYWDSKTVPENICEEFELRGEFHYCFECPNYVKPADKRVKKVRCDICNCIIDSMTPACEYLYKKIKDGEIDV